MEININFDKYVRVMTIVKEEDVKFSYYLIDEFGCSSVNYVWSMLRSIRTSNMCFMLSRENMSFDLDRLNKLFSVISLQFIYYSK